MDVYSLRVLESPDPWCSHLRLRGEHAREAVVSPLIWRVRVCDEEGELLC